MGIEARLSRLERAATCPSLPPFSGAADGSPADIRSSIETFKQYVTRVAPRFRWFRHCEAKAEVFQAVVDGHIKRLMVFEPPRHGKSEMVSRLLSAYYLSRFPHRWVGLCSYGAELAHGLSRNVRDNYIQGGGPIKDDASAVKHWETGLGGGMWAAGIGGPIAGKGWHLGIFDDWLKNDKEAASETIRNGQKDWFVSTFMSREEPNEFDDPDGALILAGTRWHEDDVPGWLLEREREGDDVESWHILRFEAIKSEAVYSLPPTCTLIPDWRKEGEPLCPERRPLEKLNKIKSKSDYYFEALYQQNPTPKEGLFFKVNNLVTVDSVPAMITIVRAWDLAATEGDGDYTAGVKIGTDAAGLFYVLDVKRERFGPDKRDALMKETAKTDGGATHSRLAEDPGQAGKDQSQRLIRMLAGYPIRAERITGDKPTRASGFASQVNAGNVRMLKGAWNAAFKEELRQFDKGAYDDQVDAASDAFNELTMYAGLGHAY